MKIPELLEDLAIISQLGDNPGSDDGLSAEALKAKFDEAALKIQKYINTVLIPAVNPAVIPKDYFAPAGYGLGEDIVSKIDLDTVTKSGNYKGSVNLIPGGITVWCRADMASPNYGTMTAFSEFYGGFCAKRTKSAGVWGEWEWISHPMIPGKEYRTTERWNEKVVYVKLVNFGNLPNATYGLLDIGVDESKIISVEGIVKSEGYAEPFPPIDSANGTAQLSWWISGTALNVKTLSNLSTSTLTLTIKYFKD